jgi:hypothetical protein
MQKQARIEMPKLRKSAKDAPQCFLCNKPNRGDVVLCHSNWAEHGKGVGYKAHDIFSALCCQSCHDHIDGRAGDWSVDMRRLMWGVAHRATLVYWIQAGILKA